MLQRKQIAWKLEGCLPVLIGLFLAGCGSVAPIDPPGVDAGVASDDARQELDGEVRDLPAEATDTPVSTDAAPPRDGASDSASDGAVDSASDAAGESRPPLVCAPPMADCNASLVDGCEAALNTEARCGACEVKCQSPTPYCATVAQVSSCVNPAAALHDQRMEWPCVHASASSTEICDSLAAGETCPDAGKSTSRTITIGGKTGTTYELTLRFRGVLEPKVYAGGRGPGDHFYVGGEPVESNYNVYRLAVSAPREVYYLNYDEGAGESHQVFTINHTKAIRVSAGATVTLDIADRDCALVRNCRDSKAATCQPLVVSGVPPAPASFDGQFVHIEVLAVTPVS